MQLVTTVWFHTCTYTWLQLQHLALWLLLIIFFTSGLVHLSCWHPDSGCRSTLGYSVSLKSFDVFLLQISHLERGSLR